MPTLRLIYLPEQYAGVTEDDTNNTTTAAAELPTTRSIHEQSRFPIDDATKYASSNITEPPAAVLGGDKMALLQAAIDEVNRRTCSFGSHDVVRYQQEVPAHEEMVLSSDEESENGSSSLLECVDTVQPFQDEMVSSHEKIVNDSTSSVHLDAIQHKSGNKRKRTAPKQSFDDRFNDLMAFKAKYGHCNVSYSGEDASLGKWCNILRGSYTKIQNNQKPITKLSDEKIQRLSDAGFKWSSLRKGVSGFDKHFNDLMSFKAKYGHCNVSHRGEDTSLGKWCSTVRGSYKKMQNNQKPRNKLSDEQIQRLSDAGFKWCRQKRYLASMTTFDERFNGLMAFKTKYGHCDVSYTVEDASLWRWCSVVRGSYKKMQNNQKPITKLSDEQIQRLSDAGFKWCRQKRAEFTSMKTFDERYNDLMAFKTKYGHCDVSYTGEDASLGKWCNIVRGSYTKIQNNQKPITKLSDEQIQRLSDAGFNWSLRKGGSVFDKHFNDLMAFKAKYGHCNVSQYGEDVSLGQWCNIVRGSYKKMQNNQKPRNKLSDEQIQRLSDAGFKWCRQNKYLASMKTFDERFNDLMSFKAKYGHCDVSYTDEDVSLGRWCSVVRGSYKKIQNNQKPRTKLSDEQIQRLSDAGFKWCL